ncbi:MAG: BPSL1445 family SYLF domain-containing lipoprotein [Reyranella sp.]
MRKRLLLSATASAALLGASGCAVTTERAAEDPAARKRRIDASVDAALTKLYAQVSGSRELVAKASGVLVFPDVISAGFVVGGSYGEGAVRTGPRTAGYYKMVSAAVGLLAGAQSRAVYVLFMTQAALAAFAASKGWTAGVDASVAAATVGANGEIDLKALQAPIVGFVLTNVGLMANLSLEGTRFVKLDP